MKIARSALILPLSLAAVAAFAAPGADVVISAPTSYAPKVLVEEYTGTWCGFCPDGALKIEELMEANPGQVFGVAYHEGDEMESPEHTELAEGLGGIKGFPQGSVNRLATEDEGNPVIANRGYWKFMAEDILAGDADCGLKIESSVSGSNATINVSAGFASKVLGEIRLSVLVIEDGITGYPQANYLNAEEGSPLKGRGDPIEDYVQMHVFRDYITPVFGDKVNPAAIKAGKGVKRSLSWKIPADFNKKNLQIIAILSAYGPEPSDKMILNVQGVALGKSCDWD